MIFKARQEQELKTTYLIENKSKLMNSYYSFCTAFNVNRIYLDIKNQIKLEKYLRKIGKLL